MKEKWKNVEGYNGLYKISNTGRIVSYKKGKPYELAPYSNNRGYLAIGLSDGLVRRRYTMHKLVARHFIPNPENKPQVNHKDGDKHNNHVDNLEWVTQSENIQHSYKIGLRTYNSEIYHKNKYNEQKKVGIIAINLETLESFHFQSINEAARQLDCNKGNIRHVLNGKYKKHKNYFFIYDNQNKKTF